MEDRAKHPLSTDERSRLEHRISELESDLRDRLQATEKLRQSDARYRSIFDNSNDGIFLVDPLQDEILDVNAMACRMLGYTKEELLSVPMSLIHPHEMEKVRSFANSVFENGHGWTNELTCMTKSKSILAAEISASLTELAGRSAMIAMVRDVSDTKRLEREREYLSEELEREGRFGAILGRSSALLKVIERVERVAPTDASVLLLGESGTGLVI